MRPNPNRLMLFFLMAWFHSGYACHLTDCQDLRVDFFEKKIRPVLIKSCIECHGKDEPEGKLRLDSQRGWARGGERGPAIVPGDPNASLLYQAITGHSKMPRMPPVDFSESLETSQIADFKKWIRDGAVDPRDGLATRKIDLRAKSHWAFQPIPDSFPDFKGQNPVDFFVEQNLQSAKLTATTPAEANTLTRRACFDLIGLPPDEQQLKMGRDDFMRLVDSLLESSHYGERWGRHWLDVARYSDAKDGVLMYGDARIRPFAYTYRDYVIRSFNQDLPFDEFVRQQLAADQLGLPDNSPELAALGFLTLGRMFDLNPHDVIDDQIDVVTRGFLGLTASCARCHDHKFDPIPTADYYSLYGIFASTLQPLNRPRIAKITDAGRAFEVELQAKLDQIESLRESHYLRTLKTAREKTTEYLVHVATTQPDYAETAVFFKSLVPGHLRPQIVHRWRKLLELRAHPTDPLFGPWHDLHQRFVNYQKIESKPKTPDEFLQAPANQINQFAYKWKQQGVNDQLISALLEADPLFPADIAKTYGELIDSLNREESDCRLQIDLVDSKIRALKSNSFNLSDIVAGGRGFGTGKKGTGLHPATGKPVQGKTGFINIPQPDQIIPVPSNPLIDGIFVPRSGKSTISTTGLFADDLPSSTGQTWDYLKFDLSSGTSESKINGIDYSANPHWVLAMHANKGITFDLKAFREVRPFGTGVFSAILGNSGASGQSKIDFFVYLDGKRIAAVKDFASQSPGKKIETPLPAGSRFLTLIATEGKQGISHDQVILGDPEITFETSGLTQAKSERLNHLENQKSKLLAKRKSLIQRRQSNPMYQVLFSKQGPLWFPQEEIEYYLSRQDRDQFRGLLNQVDAIAVRHSAAADRAMTVKDRDQLIEPVIFQRGDPGMQGNSVTRGTLSLLDPSKTAFGKGSGRLELAASIANPDNPLTARIWVNRVWMHHFGEPLVETPSDFGLQTARPLQAELLDYLARFFLQNGWRTKPLHRLIMSSATYQRSSLASDGDLFNRQMQIDPGNKYLWKGNRRRLDLEQMRDAILDVAGQLDTKPYGRPQLIGDSNNQRRTVYAFVERQNLPDIVQVFDSANADTSTSRRPNTTVPQQALFAMNSTFVLQQAKSLAATAQQFKADKEKIQFLFQRLFHRNPTATETDLIQTQLQQDSLEQIAHVLLMTNEFMFID